MANVEENLEDSLLDRELHKVGQVSRCFAGLYLPTLSTRLPCPEMKGVDGFDRPSALYLPPLCTLSIPCTGDAEQIVLTVASVC